MQLNSLHQKRWDNAKRQFSAIIERMTRDPSLVLLYHNEPISVDQIKITDTEIMIVDENVSYRIFEADPSYDHGLYTTVTEFNENIRKNFRMMREVKW